MEGLIRSLKYYEKNEEAFEKAYAEVMKEIGNQITGLVPLQKGYGFIFSDLTVIINKRDIIKALPNNDKDNMDKAKEAILKMIKEQI